MKKRADIVLLVIVLVITVGCSALNTVRQDPRAECVLAQKTFAACVRSLTELKKEGVFDETTEEKITILITEGRDILDKWHADVLKGIPPEKSNWTKIQGIIGKLTTYKKGR